jgi:Na+:H+ antiporter, NhaA family
MPTSTPRTRLLTPLVEFLRTEAAGGVVLAVATVAALLWINVDATSYTDIWSNSLTLGAGDASIRLDLQHWVNDGLMAVFFFVVGLEIKRELVVGELRDLRTAALPAIAALGGMVLPAAVYSMWNAGGPGRDGWGIPMATDIAFAVGVLALLGSRASPGLRLFVLTLAIVDDIGAIVVIAVFYADDLDGRWLAAAVALVVVLLVARRFVTHPFAYVPLALALWVCVYESGVHATLAGVVLGLCTPARTRDGREPLARLEHVVHPFASFVVVPLFALANAGIVIGGDAVRDAAGSAITWGVATGLVIGKLVGIVGATALAIALRVGRLPSGMTRRELVAGAALAGIGFTVSLFIADLSFSGVPDALSDAKLGVLFASVVAGVFASAILWFGTRATGDDADTARTLRSGSA